MIFIKILKFLFCFIVWIQDFIKKVCKTTVFFFKKSWDIWNPKFQQNSIVYYFFFIFLAFLAFCFLFHLSKLVKKWWNFLKYFFGRVGEFANDFWKILKVHFKKNNDMWIFFFQNFAVYYLFFSFLYHFGHFIFNFVYLYLSKILDIFMFFYFID